MFRLIKLHVIFLVIAMFIAFALVPLDQVYFGHQAAEDVNQYYQDAFNFESGRAWKIVFTWFLGLSCGRIMFKALTKQ